MSTIKLLASLQAIDLELDSDRRKFAENKRSMTPPTELRRQASLVQESEAKLEKWQKERRSRDDKVSELSKKIKKLEKQLYGGGIRDPREQVAMQRNIESLKRHLEDLEESALEALLEQEAAEQARDKARETFDSMKQAWLEKKTVLEKEQDALVQHARILKGKREQIVAALSPTDVGKYEAMRKKLGGVAIVKLEGRNCGGCGASLPTAVVQKVREGQPTKCPICGRLLYD